MVFKSYNEESLALLQNLVPFVRKSLCQSGGATRILQIQLAVRFKRPPNGVVFIFPSDSASAAARAAIHEKIPVVSGHAIVAPCLRARTLRSSSIVVTLPRGTWRMSWSTSIGAGITNVPVPHRLLLAASMGQTLGSPLLSASFSCQLFFLSFIPLSPTRRADRVPSIGMTYYFRGAGWPSTPAGGCSMAYWSSSRSSFFRR